MGSKKWHRPRDQGAGMSEILLNPLTMNFLNEFGLGARGKLVFIQHVPCKSDLEVDMVPWQTSADGEYTISFQSVMSAIATADEHLRHCGKEAR
jgi:hypothetical protein